RELVEAGADVLDLGGESTRPGAKAVSAVDELDRVLPVLAAVREALPTCAISIDTYKAEVADAAIENGADIINDVWGLTHGMTAEQLSEWQHPTGRRAASLSEPLLPASAMAAVAFRRKCPVILMHNRRNRNYSDFWGDLLGDLNTSLA